MLFSNKWRIYNFKPSCFPESLPTVDKRLNLDIRKSLSEVARFILEFNKIVRDCITSKVLLPLPDSYSRVIPSFAISAAFTWDSIEFKTLWEDW